MRTWGAYSGRVLGVRTRGAYSNLRTEPAYSNLERLDGSLVALERRLNVGIDAAPAPSHDIMSCHDLIYCHEML